MSEIQPTDEDRKRLQILVDIFSAVQRGSRHLRLKGAKKICREALYFIWDCRNDSKYGPSRERTRAAAVQDGQSPDYEHAVPISVLVDRIMAEETSVERLWDILQRWHRPVLVTKAEHEALRRAGLSNSMPAAWDERDPYARYAAIGIEVLSGDIQKRRG